MIACTKSPQDSRIPGLVGVVVFEMPAVAKGLILGFVNLMVVGLLIGFDEGVRHLSAVLTTILVIGIAPALAVGALVGFLGGRLSVFRRLVMVWLPLTVVVVLGVLSEARLIGPAVLPTMIG